VSNAASTVKSKLRKLCLVIALIALVAGLLTGYSYRRLLALERQHMPDLFTISPPSTRSVRFSFCDPWTSYLPHWTLSYPERQVTDLRYVTPSITVDIFGRLADASSKDVRISLGIY
jgi:hypothetical protein